MGGGWGKGVEQRAVCGMCATPPGPGVVVV